MMRCLTLLLATVFFVATAYAQPYTGHLGARVSPQTSQEMQEVLSSARAVLSDRIGYGGVPIDVVITPEQLNALQRRGIKAEIIIADVQAAINAERSEIGRRAALGAPWHENYTTLI
jgi:hypothetical protein